MNKLAKLKQQYLEAKDAYYNKKRRIMTDAEFDQLEDNIRKLDPEWVELEKTGSPVVNKKFKTPLDEFMPSLNKAYPHELPKFLDRVKAKAYIRMHKIDGTSLQLKAVDGVATKLVTRGNGEIGKDITFLLPALNIKLPKFKGTRTYRIEAVISKKAYKKWAGEFDDARSMVNGLFNRRVPHPAMKDVDLIVLGRYGVTLVQGLDEDLGSLIPVPYEICGATATNAEALTKHLELVKEKGHYEVDGLVIAPGTFTLEYENNDKPKNIIAFKVNSDNDTHEVTVEKIIWQVTGRKRIVPKIYIKPTKIGGVMVKHAAAHNAKWMSDRKIGPGAVLKVVRSGGVIPKILPDGVLKAGKHQPPGVPYKMDGVHFVLDESKTSAATDNHVEVLNIVKFAKTLGIELIAGKTAADLHHAGLISPMSYFRMFRQPAKMMQMFHDAGYAGTQGKKIRSEIAKCFNGELHLKRLMVAFQCFGVGIGLRKLDQIEEAGISMAEVLRCPAKDLGKLLGGVDGYSDKTIKVIADGHEAWRDIVRELKLLNYHLDGKLPVKPKKATGKLTGQNFAWTGYRSKEEEQTIQEMGGTVGSLGSKTNVLFYNPDGKFMEKVEKARSKGVRCTTFKEFLK